MEISFRFNSITGNHIATKFGTCHDSPAVVPCAKYCSDHFISIWMRAKWNFHHIWIVMEKLLVKWAPGTQRAASRESSIDSVLTYGFTEATLAPFYWHVRMRQGRRTQESTISISPGHVSVYYSQLTHYSSPASVRYGVSVWAPMGTCVLSPLISCCIERHIILGRIIARVYRIR